jgi:hypothetical protein
MEAIPMSVPDEKPTGLRPVADPEAELPRLRFGDLEHQTIPFEWAELMLSELFRTKKQVFGQALRAVALGDVTARPGGK